MLLQEGGQQPGADIGGAARGGRDDDADGLAWLPVLRAGDGRHSKRQDERGAARQADHWRFPGKSGRSAQDGAEGRLGKGQGRAV
ncbi:hypothetical protein [Dankookia sp. P2]|uniref:hypothetical protein n=1 Tax=Dankookia sp. P2 TaxID=3423955 RepID=UPI003D67A22B